MSLTGLVRDSCTPTRLHGEAFAFSNGTIFSRAYDAGAHECHAMTDTIVFVCVVAPLTLEHGVGCRPSAFLADDSLCSAVEHHSDRRPRNY